VIPNKVNVDSSTPKTTKEISVTRVLVNVSHVSVSPMQTVVIQPVKSAETTVWKQLLSVSVAFVANQLPPQKLITFVAKLAPVNQNQNVNQVQTVVRAHVKITAPAVSKTSQFVSMELVRLPPEPIQTRAVTQQLDCVV